MDKAQRLWLGLYRDGVAIYDTQHKKLQRIVGNIPKDLDVRCFHEDANGKIFIGTEQGVYSYNNHRWTKEDSINQLLTGTNIRSIIRDLEGNLWIANTGLDILSPSYKRIQSFTQNNGFPSNAINHLFKDSKNRIWVASRNGLILFEKGIQTDQFQHFNMEEKLNNSEVRAIQED
jgi:ligand-binding sensor domain-containing protein